MATTRPTSGVFIAWDVEDVEVQRRDAGTVRDRTVVTSRHMVTVQTLWTNEVTAANVASAERYAVSIRDQYDNVRVQVFTGGAVGSTRR